ncbi:CDP-diacylglycerol pyrophosphatase [Providencia heimbachae]|nr:CDP-diacylglycerol pyrophosphatase [Providencia heimbachae]
MIMQINKGIKVFLAGFLLLLIAALGYIAWIKLNSDALWNIVSQQCVPLQHTKQQPASCLKVDTSNQYVLFEDRNGPLHNLVIPTNKITGIESPLLLAENTPSYFSLAWQERADLSRGLNKTIPEELLAVAVNSQYGRSQDQLHIHIACLKKDILEKLNDQQSVITSNWTEFPIKLEGHHYLAKRITTYSINPFKLLQEYALQHDDNIGHFGLAMVQLKDGSLVLLANRMDLWDLNLGSAGEILDYQCLANQ